MNTERIREEFESLAKRLGYDVRYEKGDFKGDVCRIKEEKVIIINKLIPYNHQNYAFSRIFADEDLSQLSILPVLRDMIEEVSDLNVLGDVNA
ncbi:MAG: hypothetical protein K9N35_10140 [Candidatus Marinimicrobia bacterium]|nr:hypothetical protein [Candidatus Neomarinimicrobiota bacterium]